MTYRTLIAVSATAALAVTGLWAQNKAAASASAPAKIPRAADGHPSLDGVWSNATRTPLERPAEFAGKATLTDVEAREWETKEHQAWQELDGTSEGPLHKTKGSEGTGAYNVLFYDMGNGLARVDGVKRTSMVIDPPDGKIPPMLAPARARFGRRAGDGVDDVKERGLSERCIITSMAGPPMLPTLYNNNYQIVQTPDTIMIMVEEIHDVRLIHMNAQHKPANVRQWTGDSIGHWDGDTLVVETANFTPQTRFRGSSQDLKVTERFTRVNDKTILYKETMEDPSTWDRPWTLELPFIAQTSPIYEYAFHEGNYAIEDILGGARKIEASEKK